MYNTKKLLKLVIPILFWLMMGCNTPSDQKIETQSDHSFEKIFTLGGAPIEVKVRLSDTSLPITDFLTMTVLMEYQEGVKPIPLLIKPDVYHPLVLVEKPVYEEQWLQKDNFVQQKWQFKFEAFNSGKYSLKAFEIYFRLEKERVSDISKWPVYKIVTEPIPFEIEKVEIDPNGDLAEIRGFILPPFEWHPVLAALAASLLIFLAYFGLQWYLLRGKPDVSDIEIPDYYKIALQSLDQLNVDQLINRQEIDQLHTKLSDILRSYLENYFLLKAREQTTEEFLRDISFSTQFSGDQRNLLQQFLRLADLVKFATFEPDIDASRNAFKSVRNFVLTTGNKNGI
jgi:hypothetical protein